MKIRLNLIISLIMMGLLLSLTHSGQATPFTFTKVADTNTPVPGGIDNFTLFGTPSLDNGIVTFMGYDFPGGAGRYTSVDGSLQSVPDTNSPTFGGNEAVLGVDSSGRQAIYTDIGGSLTKVIGVNDSLDGRIVSSLSFGHGSLSGNSIAFTASFGGSEGIFVATPEPIYSNPEPSTLALFGVAILGTLAYGWRRRKQAA